MRVAVAFDHRGTKLRERVLSEVTELGHEPVDLGTDDPTVRIDYPDKAAELAHALLAGEAERGILVCGSAWAPRSRRRRSTGSALRSATTSTPRTRG